MKIVKISGLSVAFALASCGGSAVALKQSEVPPSSGQRDLAREVLSVVNQHRAKIGQPTLKYHAGLSRMAKKHSDYMRDNAGKFSLQGEMITHYGFDGRAKFALEKYRVDNLGENVVASRSPETGSAEQIFQGWMKSADHKHNMESDWALTGISASYGPNGEIFVTQLFGTKPLMTQTVGAPTTW
ncbi:MAG: CAP domain-containing protein [Verrucomicrobiota bacterium JB023]|nr:CAP domain-containing protein [Verrucomicrobiota bacterium JB023]